MGVTTTVASRRGKELRELSRDTTANTDSKSRKNRRKQRKAMFPIQRLFNTCKEVFSDSGPNVIPSPEDIQRLKAVLGMSTSHAMTSQLCFGIERPRQM